MERMPSKHMFLLAGDAYIYLPCAEK